MQDHLRTHDVVLRDGDLVLRPMTEDDWATVAVWNNDPRVLWFTDNGAVAQRSLAELKRIHRGVSQAAELFVFELGGVPVGDGWVQEMNLPRLLRAFPGHRLARIDLQLSPDVWGTGIGTRGVRLMTAHAFATGYDLVFGCDVADFNERSRRMFFRCGYVPWRRVRSRPEQPTAYVHDLICRPAMFSGTAPVQEHPGDDRIMAGDPPFGATIIVHRRTPALELLVLHRAGNGPDYEGDWAWTPPAGARFPAEPIDECAARELHEEAGIDAIPTRLLVDRGWALYGLDVDTTVPIVLDKEHDRFQWVSPDEAIRRCQPEAVTEGIREAVELIA